MSVLLTAPSRSALHQLWVALGGVLTLQADAFRSLVTHPDGDLIALIVVLLAGFSTAIGQGVVLFLNRVQPVRFVFSLLINAVLFVFGFWFLVLSAWSLTLLPGTVDIPLGLLSRSLGIAYAPLLFSFLGALPYFGEPLLVVLSAWHLLSLVLVFSGVGKVSLAAAFQYLVLGWVLLQILQNTVGQPIANWGRWLANQVAGVSLTTEKEGLAQLLSSGLQQSPQAVQAVMVDRPTAAPAPVAPAPSAAPARSARVSAPVEPLPISRTSFREDWRKRLAPLLGFLGIMGVTIVVVLLLQPIRVQVQGWYDQLPNTIQFFLDLLWIGVIAIAVGGLLAPVEALGWWAGWYDDGVEKASTPPVPPAIAPDVERYVVYLDGIGQSTSEQHLPDVTQFLTQLMPQLPENTVLIQDLMVYSVLNKPLDQDRPLTFLWRWMEKMRLANPKSLLGMVVNLRNMMIVAVSADRRFGPVYNQGIAQVIYNSLLQHGYQPESGVPVTLIGFSGGGQMSAAAAPLLKSAIVAPIEIISLGGVISGNCNLLQLEHLYHLVGDKDTVERLGPILFPGRWRWAMLSYWNRAKRQGKISIISLGPVGHQVPGGIMDPDARLPDGRTFLEQTLDYVLKIVAGQLLSAKTTIPRQPSNYRLYQKATFHRPEPYPAQQTLSPALYQPIGAWMGRLILPQPEERATIRGVKLEVYHTPPEYAQLVGQVVWLRWAAVPEQRSLVQAVRRDVHFSPNAEFTSEYGGLIHPERLNRWRQVGPLESLAGSHPTDDVTVMLTGPVTAELTAQPAILAIEKTPVQITGRFYALVQFVAPVAGSDQFRVRHFQAATRQFDGPESVVSLPPVIPDQNGCFPSTTRDLERSPLNEQGWYIYGAMDETGQFVVQALAPRQLFRLQPDSVLNGRKAAYRYIRQEAWADIVQKKGRVQSVLLTPRSEAPSAAIAAWQEGDRALVVHVYGGIGGKKREPAASGPIYFGHFAYGVATVVRDPLADELRFDITYYQVYTHNPDGLIAGLLHWSRYMGDRQFGWAGIRPVCDILVKLEAFTGTLVGLDGKARSPLNLMLRQLEAMTARYRIGDGTGGTYVGPANNCAQDSNQALFASIRTIKEMVAANAAELQQWAAQDPTQEAYFHQLMRLGRSLQNELQVFGRARSDWQTHRYNLGSTLEDAPLRNLRMGLGSWRTLLPRLASDTVVRTFLKYGATVWVLRTNQIGGYDPDIEPIAPITL